MSAADLIDSAFLSYNGGRLREGCRLFTERMLDDDVTVGITLTGALTPAGLGMSALVPLIEAGFVDWIISTGANLYHDTHFGLGLEMRQGNPHVSDVALREEEVVRIYDIFFDYSVLLDTDAFFRRIIREPSSSAPCRRRSSTGCAASTSRSGRRRSARPGKSLLATCWEYDVPVYTSSPGDSSIGMNVAAGALQGLKLQYDVNADVNETASIVLDGKRRGGKSAIVIFGGGSARRTSRCRRSRRSRKCSASRRRATTTSCSSRMRAPTRAAVRRDAGRGRELGQGRSGPAAGRGGVLHGLDDRAAAAHGVRADRHAPRAAEAAVPAPRRDAAALKDEYEKSSRNEAAKLPARGWLEKLPFSLGRSAAQPRTPRTLPHCGGLVMDYAKPGSKDRSPRLLVVLRGSA
jgi:deoxyhypusine synthase